MRRSRLTRKQSRKFMRIRAKSIDRYAAPLTALVKYKRRFSSICLVKSYLYLFVYSFEMF